CCANNSCTTGGCCVYSYQSTVGNYLSVCTAAASTCPTSPSNACATGSCGTCGGVGQPCCLSNASYYVCTAPNSYCPSQSSAATCTACGGMGQPCCGTTSIGLSNSSTGTCTGTLTCKLGTSSYTCQM